MNKKTINDTVKSSDIEALMISKEKKPRAKKQIKSTAVKIKPIPEVYTEDTFDITNDSNTEIIIENKTKVKHKKFISRVELINSPAFILKIKKITSRIEFEKNFDFLWNYVESTKLLRSVYIDSDTDEYDIILEEVVLYFKKRLKRIDLSYEVYSNIENYFENLKSLYGRFKRMSLSENDELVAELEKVKGMSDFIKYYLF